MNTYQAADIRNFAIVGHASAGKTLLSEAMLLCGGEINRLGSVPNGTTVSDYHSSEQKRQISIHASPLHTEWQGKKFNIIDTPGYMDFISEGLGALRVGDFALVVVHALHGVLIGTEQVWRYATQYGIPKMIVVNALDKEETHFEATLEQVRKQFGSKVFPMTMPINPGPDFNQVLDVLRSEVITFKSSDPSHYDESPAAGPLKDRVDELHRQLIELIAESDDTLLQKYFDQGGLSEQEMRSGIHAAIQKQSIIPLFVTSAEKSVGVARLMDFIAKYGSSPIDRAKVEALDQNGEPLDVSLTSPEPVLYVFKTLSEPQVGDLSFFRVYAGTVTVGMDLYNSDRKVTERLGQIYILNGKNRTSANSLNAGDIGATVKLRDTHTGNTLCDPKRVVSLAKVKYPEPNIHAALKLNSKGDEDKIATGLAALHEEDPTFIYHVDSELHQTVISAQGELHLQVLCERLQQRYKVDIELIQPRIRYRETIKAKADSKYRHKKQTGGAGQFAEVWMRIEPKPRDSQLEFCESLVGQNVDRGFVPSVQKGVMSACNEGVLAGYRVVDVKIEFYDGKMHPVDSNDVSFQIAGKAAFKEAFLKARPCLLEPILEIDVRVSEDTVGKVMGDLSSRRGKILGMDSDDGYTVLKATVPEMELYHYSSVLRSLTGGRGRHSEKFSHYEEMPKELELKIIAQSKKHHEET